MTAQNGPRGKRGRPPGTARIDDVLVIRHATRQQLLELLDSAPADGIITPAEVRALRKKCQKAGPDALRELMSIYVADEALRSDKAFIVLGDFPDAELHAALTGAFSDPRLTREDKVRLLALSAFEPDREHDLGFAAQLVSAHPGELLRVFTDAVGEKLEPEEIGLMWLQDFADQPLQDKLVLLGYLAQHGDAHFLPAFEIESCSHHTELRCAVARAMRHFAVAEALEIALRMQHDHSPAVRYDAHASAELLDRVGELRRFLPPPRFRRAVCLLDHASGTCSIFYAVLGAREQLKFCNLLVDTWGGGILDVWGNVGFSETHFDEILRETAAEAARQGLETAAIHEIGADHALFLISEALRLSNARRKQLPPEFYVWERLFRCEPFDFDPSRALVRFGLHCSDCGCEIIPNRQRTNLLTRDKRLLCRKCAAAEHTCPSCGRRMAVAGRARHTRKDDPRENLCSECRETGHGDDDG